MKKRLLCFLLTAALTLGLLAGMAPDAQAATKQEKTRAIAIVFDNSGSMYMNSRTRWCQATYAMEVFAAMMNEGDTLLVYPMWPITLGTKGNKNGIQSFQDRAGLTQDVLTINGPKEASTIREIFTPNAGGTPFSTVTNAYEGLMQQTADEKYLIVLTDGAFLDGAMSSREISSYLDTYAKDVNVMFLGMGISTTHQPTVSNSAKQYYRFPATVDAVLSELTQMSNRIFGRNELETRQNNVTFDVSMNKIIIFVQGEGIDNVSLNGGIKVSEHATKYSTYGTGSYQSVPDTSLQGMLVTYQTLDAGDYSFSYSGKVSSVSVYYEPDVDLVIQLVDENGNILDTGDDLPAGKYRLEYGLVDKYGVPTNSDLLGKQNYSISYTVDGVPNSFTAEKPGSVDIILEAGSILDGEFTVQYLNDYTIRKNGDSLGWPDGGIKIVEADLTDIVLNVTGGSAEYKLSTLEQEAVYRVTATYEGNPITGDDLQNTMFSVDLTGGNAEYKLDRDVEGYTVTIRYNGDAANTSCGEYSLSMALTYTHNGCSGTSNTEIRNFTVVDDSTALGASLELAQTFFQTSKLDEAEPIYLNLTMGGLPMDSRTFSTTLVKVDIPGVAFELQPDPDNSRYIITLVEDGVTPTGKNTITATVSGFDEIGRAVTTQATAKIELQSYPSWLPGLIAFLVSALLIALIWLYLNTKILPKHISTGTCTFIVDGEIVTGSAKCVYTGKNKRRGTLSVQSPHYGANPAAKCGYTLELEAVSPRRVRSAARSIQVVNVRPLSATSTIAVQVGGCNLSKDPTTGKLVKAGGKPGAPISFKVGNKAKTSVTAEVMDMANGGGEVTVSMSVPLKFL